MGHSVKWVIDKLGITRDMLRYYEKEKLLPANESRNPTNKYRDYSDEDIERIWGIKLLLGIGFTAKEIYALINDPDFDFDTAIAKKVEELERKHDESLINLEFAKSIKLSGRCPTTSKIGSMKFDDFLAYAKKNWNYFDDPRFAPFMKMADKLISKPQLQEWSPDDVEHIINYIDKLDFQTKLLIDTQQGYFNIISEMRDLDYSSDTVQIAVRLLHKNSNDLLTSIGHDGNVTPQSFAKQQLYIFRGGDVAKLQERLYGKEGCQFIVQALAYYGGIDIDDL